MEAGTSLKRALLVGFVASLGAAGVVGAGVFLVGSVGEMQARVLATTLASAGFSLAGLCAAVWYDRDRRHRLATAGLVASAAGLALSLLGIWAGDGDVLVALGLYRAIAASVVVSAAIAHASLLLLTYGRSAAADGIVVATLAGASGVAVLLLALIAGMVEARAGFFRVIGVIGLLTIAGTIAAPVLARIDSTDR